MDVRLHKWMSILNAALEQNAPFSEDGIFFFEKKVCYVDFAVLAILDGIVDEFGLGEYIGQFKLLAKHFKQMSARSSVQKLWAVQKPNDKSKWWKWCGGQIQLSIEKSIKLCQK
mmetsp:Transcript_22313/g.35851  ORF Transcript_22313/g.35851 Transcript_22313/m.35851 type:complete len:114 (+) Transcript_22313:478-819(+)